VWGAAAIALVQIEPEKLRQIETLMLVLMENHSNCE